MRWPERFPVWLNFLKWAKRNSKIQQDPIYQIEKPKRLRRIPVWIETEEQNALIKANRNHDDIPDNIFGRSRDSLLVVRQRYELLFELIQKSGLRISEALGLKIRDARIVDGVTKSIRVIGKGNKERQVPLPESFGWVLALSVVGKGADAYLFAKKPVSKPPTAHAMRSYLKKLIDIQALLGHESIATTQIYTHAGQERLSKLVADI